MTKPSGKIFLGVCFFALGIVFGTAFYKANFYCVEVISPKTPFYGMLAKKISDGLHKRGYFLRCPVVFPKTVIHFYNTSGINDQISLDKYKKCVNFLVHGDCLEGTDITYLKKFDVILNVNEFLNGFISTANLRTAYLPLTEKQEKFCKTDFDKHKIDTELLVKRLDDIIQGVRHEKF